MKTETASNMKSQAKSEKLFITPESFSGSGFFVPGTACQAQGSRYLAPVPGTARSQRGLKLKGGTCDSGARHPIHAETA